MRIFVSYASEDRDTADRLAVGLRQEGHKVFFDRDDLRGKGNFDEKIRHAIRCSDYAVFLLSPDAVSPKAYFLTEVGFAREVWPSPDERVLPVTVRPTDLGTVPAYLRAAGVFAPNGDLVAEVLAEVEKASKQRTRRGAFIAAGLTTLATAIATILWWFQSTPPSSAPCQLVATWRVDTSTATSRAGKIKVIGGTSRNEFLLNSQGKAPLEVSEAQLPAWTIEVRDLDGRQIAETPLINGCPEGQKTFRLGDGYELQISPR